MTQAAVWAACLLFVLAMAWDVRRRRIPNAIPLALAALFGACALAGGAAPAPLWAHLATGGALLAAGFALYLGADLGPGDGKLLAAAGLWVGPRDLGVFLAGMGACALLLCLFALLPFPAARRMRSELPFAAAIAPPAAAVLAPRALA